MKSRDVEHVHAPRDFFFTEKKMKLKTHFQENLSFINSSFSNKPFKSIFYIFLQFYLKLKLLSTLKLKWSIKSMYVYFLNSLIQMFLQHISSVHIIFYIDFITICNLFPMHTCIWLKKLLLRWYWEYSFVVSEFNSNQSVVNLFSTSKERKTVRILIIYSNLYFWRGNKWIT